MSQLRQGLLPLDLLDDQQFETFLLRFLGAGISLEVLEPAPGASGKSSRAIRHRIVHATKYGAPGLGGQRGIDIRARTETGADWVFQCKHYASAFPPAKARAAIAKAEKEYPAAARYFLVLSSEPTPDVRELVEARPNWEIWGGSELSVRFLNETPRLKQIEILRRLFPGAAEGIVALLFPRHDDLLIDTEQFFARWLDPKRPFNHAAPLVGRAAELQSLHDFAGDTEYQALILPAPGGIGKTRLLRAFGETFPVAHPGKRLLFVDPYARPNADSDRLRAAGPGELVVIQDDAHRSESLRADLAASILDKGGKLVLATRPHGVDALVAWLAHAGYDYARIRVLDTLSPLPRRELIDLARACLPPTKSDFAEPLAGLAKGCTLIVTVGARLLAENDLHPSAYLDSQDFQRAVFDRFETDGYAQLAARENVPRLRDTLRLIAVLAPWNEQTLSLDAAAELIHGSPRALLDDLETLQAAGLLVQTREGRRVVPDLFADHLAYRGCYDADGRLTSFARRLQTALLGKASGTILRNLAEAEWQARLKGPSAQSILDPFWQELLVTFEKANFWERSRLVVEWHRFAVLQPERSLRLARLALALDEAPPPPAELHGLSADCSLNTHEQVLGELPAMLEPIAVYHADHRAPALQLLWELHLKLGRVNENAQNDPLATIGRVAKFVHRHPADAPPGVVRWLADLLRDPAAAEPFDRPSPALSVMLKPLFEHEVENTYQAGRTIHFQNIPLSVPRTRPIREETLAVLRDQVIPRGEIATLNALGVLDSAIDIARRRWGGAEQDRWQDEWLPERLAALRIIESLIVPAQSPRVLLRITRMLRPHAYRDTCEAFKAESQRLLDLIPDTPPLRLARLLTSDAWSEFYHDTEHEDTPTEQSRPTVETLWDNLADQVAQEFLAAHADAESVIIGAEALAADYQRAGLSPQFSDLFRAIARRHPELGDGGADALLARRNSPVDYWWTSWFLVRRKLPDPRLLTWIRAVLRGDNRVRWRAAQNSLRWRGIGEINHEVLSEVAAWAARLDDDTLDEVLERLRWRGDEDRPIDETILLHLDLARLSAKNIRRLGACLRLDDSTGTKPLPPPFLARYLTELRRIDTLFDHDGRRFPRQLAKAEPLAFYEMLKRRVLETESRRAAGEPFDPLPVLESPPLVALPSTPDYAALVEDLVACWRSATKDDRFWWRHLFQDAVLRVSPLGLAHLKRWLAETTSPHDIEEIIDALQFQGSRIIFTEPDFVLQLLAKIRAHAPAQQSELEFSLRCSASPRMRGFTNGELDPEHRYYREEAAKAVEIFARDPELSAFYREIVRAEAVEAASQRRWVTAADSEWD